MNGPAPIILAAWLGDADQSWLDGLRQAHSPPERNQLAAHLTMFHHLPPSAEAELKSRLATATRAPRPDASISDLMSLGRGVAYYNEQKGTNVEVLGWDINNPDAGLFSSSFDDQAKGRELGISLMDEGADIIMPVAGPVGWGTVAAVQERGNAWVIGVDSDWALDPTASDAAKAVILTSVLKNMDVTTFESIKQVVDGNFQGGSTVVGSMSNNGVGIAPFYGADSQIPAELKAELETVKAGIIDGSIKTRP